MTENSPPDQSAAHKLFAIEFNNRCWDLVEQTGRTAEETSEMLSTAHAAMLHWSKVGTELNKLRALVLLVAACVRARLPDVAAFHSQRLDSLTGNTEGETPFDRVTALGALAYAHHLNGNHAQASACYRRASETAQTLSEEERQVFNSLFPEIV